MKHSPECSQRIYDCWRDACDPKFYNVEDLFKEDAPARDSKGEDLDLKGSAAADSIPTQDKPLRNSDPIHPDEPRASGAWDPASRIQPPDNGELDTSENVFITSDDEDDMDLDVHDKKMIDAL